MKYSEKKLKGKVVFAEPINSGKLVRLETWKTFQKTESKFTHNTTFRTLYRILSVSGGKILKSTEVLLYNAAVHQTIFTVNPMTGSCHKTYHPVYQQ